MKPSTNNNLKDNQIKVLVDGRCFVNEASSISVYLHNLLKNLINNEDYFFTLVINNPSYQAAGFNNENISTTLLKIKNNILWDNFIIPFYALKTGSKLIFYPKSSSCCFRIPGKRIITTIHGMVYVKDKKNKGLVERVYWKAAGKIASLISNKIIAVSESDKKDLISTLGCKQDKMEVIPIGVNEIFLGAHNAANSIKKLHKYSLESKKYFIQIGSITRKKNQIFTVKVLKDILQNNKFYKLVLIGPKERDSLYYDVLVKYLEENSLFEQVVFLGGMDQNAQAETMSALMQNAILGLFPSTYEGFGIPPLEMIASRIPVLISNRGALNEVYGENNTLPLEDESLWTDEVRQLISNENYYNSVLQRQRRVVEKYNWNNIAMEYIKLFKKYGS